MGNSLFNPLFFGVISIAITSIALVYSIKQRDNSKLTRKWVVLLSSPCLVMMATFYSFVARMHSELNGWPDFYGRENLPTSVLLHENVASWMFLIALLIVFLLPLALVLFYVIPRLRPHLIYLSFFGSACWFFIFATQLAPTEFLNWWWD